MLVSRAHAELESCGLLPGLWLTYQLSSSVSSDENISVAVRSSLRLVEKEDRLNRNCECSNRLPA